MHDDNNDNIKNDTDDININKHERITKKYNNFVLNILKFYKVLVQLPFTTSKMDIDI